MHTLFCVDEPFNGHSIYIHTYTHIHTYMHTYIHTDALRLLYSDSLMLLLW